MSFSTSVLFLGLFGLLLITSCKKDPIAGDCANAGAYVKEVKNAEGDVYFDVLEHKHFIRVPNSMDSHDVGYVCSLPTTFQKEGVVVRFSGRYFEYGKAVQGIAGNKYYYLSLAEVSAK